MCEDFNGPEHKASNALCEETSRVHRCEGPLGTWKRATLMHNGDQGPNE